MTTPMVRGDKLPKSDVNAEYSWRILSYRGFEKRCLIRHRDILGRRYFVTICAMSSETMNIFKKMSFPLIPHYAVLDPRMTLTLPPHLTALKWMDALPHAVEAFIGRSTFREMRSSAIDAVKLIFASRTETILKPGAICCWPRTRRASRSSNRMSAMPIRWAANTILHMDSPCCTLRRSPRRGLGEISYPVYIMHFPLAYMQMAWVKAHASAPIAQHVAVNVSIFALALAVAWGVQKLYDIPVRAWLSKKCG